MTSIPNHSDTNDAQRREICEALKQLRWPNGSIDSEVKFNRGRLLKYLNTSEPLKSLRTDPDVEPTLRLPTAQPFFGWGYHQHTDGAVRVSKRVKTDATFNLNGTTFFVENKIIQEKRECEIKNAIVQAIEYLNLYDVVLGVLLILDAGRGSAVDWRGHPEGRLLAALTSEYPLCVARVREQETTEVFSRYCDETAQP